MSSPLLYHMVYQSHATAPFRQHELEQLLMQSRTSNTRNGITGLLLYSDGHILQVLEGQQAVVKRLFDRIEQDQRHYQVIKLADGPIQARNFSHWSMAFKTVNPANLLQLAGYQSSVAAPEEDDHISLHDLLFAFVAEDELRW
jgi:hypothetical protein